MKKLLILFLSLFLFSSQANAFALGWLAKQAGKNVPAKEKERLKKEFFKKLTAKPVPRAQKRGK